MCLILGLDLHAKQVTECRQLDGSTPKPAQQWDLWELLDKVGEWVKSGWWRPARWKQFQVELPGWMRWQLNHWQQEALELNCKERQVRQELEQMVTEHRPVGLGALSWITLQLEIRGRTAAR